MTTFRSVGLLNVLQGVCLRWPPVACLVMAAPSSLRDKNLCILRAILAGWMLAAIVAASPLMGQSPNYGVGRSPTPEEIKSWDISIGPDGKELPPGEGRAIEGKEVYTRRCADCHGSKGQGGAQGEALVGGEGTLDSTQPVKTVGSYWPYATTLWDYINRAMPFDSPGSLTHKQVYALVAYLLYLNGIIEEEEVLNAQTLPQVRMPNREGFVPDPRPDVGTKDQSQMH